MSIVELKCMGVEYHCITFCGLFSLISNNDNQNCLSLYHTIACIVRVRISFSIYVRAHTKLFVHPLDSWSSFQHEFSQIGIRCRPFITKRKWNILSDSIIFYVNFIRGTLFCKSFLINAITLMIIQLIVSCFQSYLQLSRMITYYQDIVKN